ncbi:carbon-nitrogen hydrolase family protein [Arcobacter caeni]|uniref:Carbon-nitrogen hydrolase family protein n=1 Tax=Arcobacter caeni TaxID=1912877 RepID=A0A363D314_9BACT|nr:hypothetical protein [Arcobacter caeni]PUE65477.1 hypothetical protein B0174_03920 [Arcobacter caeni]
MSTYKEYLKIGFIQTNLDSDLAWGPDYDISLQMKEESENHVWQEIKKGFHKLFNHHSKPDIIVMPELTIPNVYQKELRRLAQEMNAVVFAGLDWQVIDTVVMNYSLLVVPNKWNEEGLKSSLTTVRYLGKKFPANAESLTIKKCAENHKKDYKFISDENIYLIDANPFGKIGFAICADFYDLERYVAYKGKVQHMIILAYNTDTNSFYALAEAISRIVMCSVIICNTGKYGDSLVFSPYKLPHKRMIFRNQGADLFATQVVNLPVKSLCDDQNAGQNAKMFKVPPTPFE